jgi:hypothetical protein
LKSRRQALLQDVVRDLLDLPVPAHALGMLPEWTDGIVGLGGSLSSVIGLVQVGEAECLDTFGCLDDMFCVFELDV